VGQDHEIAGVEFLAGDAFGLSHFASLRDAEWENIINYSAVQITPLTRPSYSNVSRFHVYFLFLPSLFLKLPV